MVRALPSGPVTGRYRTEGTPSVLCGRGVRALFEPRVIKGTWSAVRLLRNRALVADGDDNIGALTTSTRVGRLRTNSARLFVKDL
jgi:hypothetical protein